MLDPRSPASRLRCVPVLVLAAAAALLPSQERDPVERDLWYAYAVGDVRYGAHRVQVARTEEGTFRFKVSTRTLFDLFEQEQEQVADAEYVVARDLTPVSLHVETESLAGVSVLTGVREADELVLTFSRPGSSREARVPLGGEEPVLLSAVVEDWLAGQDERTARVTAKVLNEENGELVSIAAERVAGESEPGERWRVSAGEEGEATTTLMVLDERGLLTEGVHLEAGERVTVCTYEEAQDLTHRVIGGRAVLSFPLDREIRAPHLLERIRVRLTWEDLPFEDFRLEDARQRVVSREEEGTRRSVVVEVRPPAPAEDAATIPVEAPDLAPFLAETEYVKPRDPEVLATARRVVADERNAKEAARLLTEFVHGYVQDQYIAETLSGPEVLACKTGKCTEHTTLFASLARAVGLPTRIALGERLVGDTWGGHMWNEVWVGRWMTVDASANEVDRSLMLLKFIDSDTVEGTQPLRHALVESLAVSVLEFDLRESELADQYETGIDGAVYTNVDFACRLRAPADDWRLHEGTELGTVLITILPPEKDEVAIHFVAFAVPSGTEARPIVDARVANWRGQFPTFELLSSEPVTVAEAAGHRSHSRGDKEDGEAPLLITDLLWIRGTSGYLLTMNGRVDAVEKWTEAFEELVGSFRFLE